MKYLRTSAGTVSLMLCLGLLASGFLADGQDKVDGTDSQLMSPPAPGKPWEPAWGYYKDAPAAWTAIHKGNVERTRKGGIDIIFYGDSITKGWGDKGKGLELFQKKYAPLNAVNYGMGGDGTRQLLWRMEHGELEGLAPKLVVLKIGTNNLYGDFNAGSDEEVAKGVAAVVAKLRGKLPNTKVLLLAILPRQNTYFCGRIQKINNLIGKLDDGADVRFLDMTSAFQTEFGKVKPELYQSDQLHLSAKGYEVWAETMEPMFSQMLGAQGGQAAPVKSDAVKAAAPVSSPAGTVDIFVDALRPGWTIAQWGGLAAAPMSDGTGGDAKKILKLGFGKAPQPWAGAVLATEGPSEAGKNAPALSPDSKANGSLVFLVNGSADEWGNHCGEQGVQVMLGLRPSGQGNFESGAYHDMRKYMEGGAVDKDPATWQRVAVPLAELLKGKDLACVGVVGFQYIGTPPPAALLVKDVRLENLGTTK